MGILSGGLSDLLSQFQQNGHGDKAQSWISTEPNKPVSPTELEQVLGPEKIDWLMKETGMSREELLAGLSRELPAAVDKLTPNGRIPTDAEAARMLAATRLLIVAGGASERALVGTDDPEQDHCTHKRDNQRWDAKVILIDGSSSQ